MYKFITRGMLRELRGTDLSITQFLNDHPEHWWISTEIFIWFRSRVTERWNEFYLAPEGTLEKERALRRAERMDLRIEQMWEDSCERAMTHPINEEVCFN